MMITVAPPVVHPSLGHIAFIAGVAESTENENANCQLHALASGQGHFRSPRSGTGALIELTSTGSNHSVFD